MGGHAFKGLHCPRISPAVYNKAKAQITARLRTIFSHVVVPTEMPCKADFGDIDFLVSGPLHSPNSTTIDNFDWENTVELIKSTFNTTHGRRGFLNPDCMYFAVAAPEDGANYFIQVDVKVCFKPELFGWYTFELNYASNSKVIGSMVKPLGLTIDPEGLHIRVEEVEETSFPGSMVWISKDPKDVLRIVGLDRRIINAGFKTKNQIYEYFASSWLFSPAHFAARLAEEKYFDRIDERSPHWTYFVKEWIPEHYPGYKFIAPEIAQGSVQQENDLQMWYKRTRAAVRERVFTMFPHIATAYYVKRAVYMNEFEEHRLKGLITEAIPTGADGWKDDSPKPQIFVKQPEPTTPQLKPTNVGELTPPLTPTAPNEKMLNNGAILSAFMSSPTPTVSTFSSHPLQLWDIPLYLDPLPRSPPHTCTPHPPPVNMSPEAKLLCLARWTQFDSSTGTPYLLSMPRDKNAEMHWTDAVYAGATNDVLTNWAREMWWHIWTRQSHVNYIGMWKKRFEKEDKKAEKAKLEAEAKAKAEQLVKANREKIMGRLEALNSSLGLVYRGVGMS